MASARQHTLAQLQQLHGSEVTYYPHTYSPLPNPTTTTTAAVTSTATNGAPATVRCPHAGLLAPLGHWGAQVGDPPQSWLISGGWTGRRGTVCLFCRSTSHCGRSLRPGMLCSHGAHEALSPCSDWLQCCPRCCGVSSALFEDLSSRSVFLLVPLVGNSLLLSFCISVSTVSVWWNDATSCSVHSKWRLVCGRLCACVTETKKRIKKE